MIAKLQVESSRARVQFRLQACPERFPGFCIVVPASTQKAKLVITWGLPVERRQSVRVRLLRGVHADFAGGCVRPEVLQDYHVGLLKEFRWSKSSIPVRLLHAVYRQRIRCTWMTRSRGFAVYSCFVGGGGTVCQKASKTLERCRTQKGDKTNTSDPHDHPRCTRCTCVLSNSLKIL